MTNIKGEVREVHGGTILLSVQMSEIEKFHVKQKLDIILVEEKNVDKEQESGS